MRVRSICIILILLVLGTCEVCSQEVRDSVWIHFRQGRSVLDASLQDNRRALDRIADSLSYSYTADSVYRLVKVVVTGGASPEGSVSLNERLSRRRAAVLFDYMSRYEELPDSLMVFRYLGRDWQGLLRSVRQDTEIPFRDETVVFLEGVVERIADGERPSDNNLGRFVNLYDGAPYRYAYRNLFPGLRASLLELVYEKVPNPIRIVTLEPSDNHIDIAVAEPWQATPVIVEFAVPEQPFYMALRTNLLEDALLVPNIGAEFYIGRQWSIGANWKYAWWKSDRRHDYWRIYGGDISVRRYFGGKAAEKPLQGHHLGLYAQIVTYDFETGGKGVMGGVPGGTLWDKMNYGGGIEYGYSMPISRRLNLDFTIGLGYIGGEYREYIPVDGCYVWQATKQRHYWGPTKAEVSLVWLLGRGNHNERKGGRR